MRATLFLTVILFAAFGAPAGRPSSPAGPSRARQSATGDIGADDAAHAEAWAAWRAQRRESLAGEEGWLTLIGLHWLDAAETTIGSDETSAIVLPAGRSPARVGRFVVRDGRVSFVPEPGVTITTEDRPVTAELALTPDDPGPPTTLALGSLRVHVIARAGRLGVRIKDRESPARVGFAGTPVYDRDLRYRVRARFVPAAAGEVLPIVNVLGQQVDEPLAGRLLFELEGQSIELLTTLGGDTLAEGLFVMFRDATSDLEDGTYPAGRYLEVDAPDASGETWVDFNFAYTPPCAFTELATCPLPPPSNELPLAITAGERAPGSH